MRGQKIFEELQARIDQVPIQNRLGLLAEFSILKTVTAQNLEVFYKLATQRLAKLAYYLEWSRTLEGNEISVPLPIQNHKDNEILISFYDIDALHRNEIQELNNGFSLWVMNHMIRELSEFLLFYSLDIYETCVLVKHAGREMGPADIVNGRLQTESFEKMGMEDRLKTLENFGFILSHRTELCSLYDARNVFAHFDGVVQKKFCKDNGKLKVFWPVNTYKLRHKQRDKFIPYHQIPKPFSSDHYDKFQITWLNKPKICLYEPMQKIQLTYSELKDLIFFYLYVFNDLQKSLICYVEEHNVSVRPFEDYILRPQIMGLTDEGEAMGLEFSEECK